MATKWLGPRRILLYGACFAGAFSLVIGLFISKHAWNLNKTVKLVENSWDRRNISHSDRSWLDKAYHALLAGHEEVGEYNDLYWEKRHRLDESGHFDRANLTQSDECRPEWATANAAYDKWGFVVYRTYYGDKDWNETLRFFNHSIRAHLEIEATTDGRECDPELVRDRAVIEVIENRELLEDATAEQVRALWRKRVKDGLVDAAPKMGGWKYGGWFKLNLDVEEAAKPNGMALNLCLVYDRAASAMVSIHQMGLPATGPRDPWEPFLAVVDGTWDPEEYMHVASWTEGYHGVYGVSLSLLMNTFHGAVYEREPERSAPYMSFGGARIDTSLPLWRQIVATVYSTIAVARPGRFPFEKRYLDMKYPFVREDSWWDVEEDKQPGVNNSETMVEGGYDASGKGGINTSPPFYAFCSNSDDAADCFQYGNFRLKKLSASQDAVKENTEKVGSGDDVDIEAPALNTQDA